MYEYWSTLGLGLFSFLLLSTAVAFNIAKAKAIIVWIAGVAAALFATAAGFHATHTIFDPVIGGILGFSPWVDLVLGLGLIAGVWALFFTGTLPPQLIPGAATVVLVAIAFLTPLAQVSHTAIPGDVGTNIAKLTRDFGRPGLTWSQTWFGRPGRAPSYYLTRGGS